MPYNSSSPTSPTSPSSRKMARSSTASSTLSSSDNSSSHHNNNTNNGSSSSNSSTKKKHINPYEAKAPSRCEVCDASLRSLDDRFAHIEQTRHCACSECGAYVPPGRLYSHWCDAHIDIVWNDHAVAFADRINLQSAKDWAREAYEREVEESYAVVES